jgi:hypothetical protein
MKLYATVTSERNSRPAKKGGAERLDISITSGNIEIARVNVVDVGQKRPLVRLVEFEN